MDSSTSQQLHTLPTTSDIWDSGQWKMFLHLERNVLKERYCFSWEGGIRGSKILKECWDLRKIWELSAKVSKLQGASGYRTKPGVLIWESGEALLQLHLDYLLWQHTRKNQWAQRKTSGALLPPQDSAAPRPSLLTWAITLNEPSPGIGLVSRVWSMLTLDWKVPCACDSRHRWCNTES